MLHKGKLKTLKLRVAIIVNTHEHFVLFFKEPYH